MKARPSIASFAQKLRSKAKGLGLAVAWAYDLAWALGHFGLARLSSACPGLAPRSLALELALAPRCAVWRAAASQQAARWKPGLARLTCLLAWGLLVCSLTCLGCLLACLIFFLVLGPLT